MAQPIHFLVSGFKDSLQNAGHKAEDFRFVVCDVNSEKERLQVNFLVFQQFKRNFSDLTAELALCHRAKTEKNK